MLFIILHWVFKHNFLLSGNRKIWNVQIMCITSGKFFQLLQIIRKTLVIVLLVVVIKIYFQFIFDKHVTHHGIRMTPFCLLFSSHVHTSNKTPPLSETSLYSWSEYTNQGPLEEYRPCTQKPSFQAGLELAGFACWEDRHIFWLEGCGSNNHGHYGVCVECLFSFPSTFSFTDDSSSLMLLGSDPTVDHRSGCCSYDSFQ